MKTSENLWFFIAIYDNKNDRTCYNDSEYKLKIASGWNIWYFVRSVLKVNLRNYQFQHYNMRYAETQFLAFNLHKNRLL